VDTDPDGTAEHTEAAKAGWRADLVARRRQRPATERQDARAAISAHLGGLRLAGNTVCAYLPLPSEPLDPRVLSRLLEAGAVLLLPVATADSPLDWCRWTSGAIRRGPFGIDEPVGDRLGAGAIATADLVLVPALAVDRAGNRIGRGGGHYDRSLALLSRPAVRDGQRRSPRLPAVSPRLPAVSPDLPAVSRRLPAVSPRLLAVIYDDELVDALPHGPLDHRVTDVVTPSGGIRPLG
jgi:5-formyltetrahydrofolate cyclo-ligase